MSFSSGILLYDVSWVVWEFFPSAGARLMAYQGVRIDREHFCGSM